MDRIIALAFIVMTFNLSAHADWKCLAICHYYLPNSSPTHPSLPPQAHESYVESWGATLEDAYRELQEICLDLGDEGEVRGTADQDCYDLDLT